MIKDIEPGSPAELGGLKPGDKILIINNENIENASYLDVVNKLKEALLTSTRNEMDLVVMNAIEYNIFKAQNSNNETDTDSYFKKNFEIENVQNNLISKSQAELNDFNPFGDINNEMYTPFLHYTSIPPPETFKQFDQFDNSHNRDDSNLEESTSDTVSSSNDSNARKEINTSFNANDLDFNFNLNLIEQNPSLDNNKNSNLITSSNNKIDNFENFALWNSANSDYAEIVNENNKVIADQNSPQLRNRF